ncbi:hypothetical protein JKP75_09090 [Blastococcus sp. TML/M2B]|uniref:hypothetical protein n=1 Tax=Blastococcus sp. TML/M2B TaxID=2798727 RepID=UPI00190C4A8A|nr:hypothetical protein [Blastococcus sp. TML/M2B]MBN1092696.1 hypothetical protein [Blastococcus sp. TML/M2B]
MRRALGSGAARVWHAGERGLSPLADALLPRAAVAVLSRLDVAGLVERFVDVQRIAGGLDVDAVAARLDVDRVAARLDLDRVLDRVDLDAVAARLDLDALVAAVDIGRVIDRLDLDELVARVDVGKVVDRVDLDRIVDRVDVDRVLDRVDIDSVLERVDLDGIVDRVDIDRVIERAHVVELAHYVVREIDLPALIRSSTSSLSTDVVRSVRDQGLDADRAVERLVDRLLLRRRGRSDGYPVEGT